MSVAPTPPETPPVVAPVADYDAMAAVFDDLIVPTGGEGDPAPTIEGDVAAAEAAAAAAAAPDVEPPPAETPPADPAAEALPAETPPVDPAAETPPVETPPVEVDWKARFEELQSQRAEPVAPAAPAPAAAPPADVYSADEKEFLVGYEKDWAEVARGEALKRRAEYNELVGHIFAEVARVYGPLVEQGVTAAEAVADTTALSAIHSVHPDFDDAMYNAVHTWAGGLTGMKRRIAQATIEDGEPEEVADLITEYKTATGAAKPRVAAGAAPAASATVTELSAKAKQAAKALGVVDSKRTVPVAPQGDPNDFDGAWNEANRA